MKYMKNKKSSSCAPKQTADAMTPKQPKNAGKSGNLMKGSGTGRGVTGKAPNQLTG
jgi:hypothetical protein